MAFDDHDGSRIFLETSYRGGHPSHVHLASVKLDEEEDVEPVQEQRYPR